MAPVRHYVVIAMGTRSVKGHRGWERGVTLVGAVMSASEMHTSLDSNFIGYIITRAVVIKNILLALRLILHTK